MEEGNVLRSHDLAPQAQTESAEPNSISRVKETLVRYREAQFVEMDIEKKVSLALLDRTRESKGRAYFSKGKLRLETKEPDPSLIIVDESAIWIQTPPVPGLSENYQVTQIVSERAQDRSRSPLAMILSDDSAMDLFNQDEKTVQGKIKEYVFLPKNPSLLPDVQKLKIKLNSDEKIILEISYTDELSNETSFSFAQVKFRKSKKPEIFKYVRPKNSEITVFR